MNQIKEFLKKNPVIVAFYEFVFGRLHRASIAVSVEGRRIKKYLTNKTHFCYGEKNKDKTFFVITCSTKEMGVYSTILYILPFIEYAVKRKYIPVIDLGKNYMPMWQDEDRKGLENPWEYYYEQPNKQYTLEEVYQSRHVIVAVDGAFRIKLQNWNAMFPVNDKKELIRWNKVIESYVRLNNELKNRVEVEQEKIFKPNHRVLGVGIRAEFRAGMMKNEVLYNNHPKQPSCEELMDIVGKKMEEWKCDYIFVSCDDREYLDKFSMRFGDKCCYIERRRLHFFKNDSPVLEIAERKKEYVGCTIEERTKEYITEVYLLSRCDSLYSCIGGGAQFAYFLNGGKYEHLEVYNQGLYAGLDK